ncbi:hypothetical protein F383_32952 [Gossypium arboreum]|uniref:Uncharacterized protein n=1 Tax=Gossypium arboreum TaxID=29729 RepID=A0A0B0N0D5_GOSAR|nr:hypothetical protein F383_32952 [Gossypium arboreum]
MSLRVRPYLGYGILMIFCVRPCLGHGIDMGVV